MNLAAHPGILHRELDVDVRKSTREVPRCERRATSSHEYRAAGARHRLEGEAIRLLRFPRPGHDRKTVLAHEGVRERDGCVGAYRSFPRDVSRVALARGNGRLLTKGCCETPTRRPTFFVEHSHALATKRAVYRVWSPEQLVAQRDLGPLSDTRVSSQSEAMRRLSLGSGVQDEDAARQHGRS